MAKSRVKCFKPMLIPCNSKKYVDSDEMICNGFMDTWF